MPLKIQSSVANLDFTLDQGSFFSHTITMVQPNGYDAHGVPVIGDPVSLVGVTAAMQLRASRGANAPVLHSMTTANGGITILPSIGVITLFIPSSATELLEPGTVYYDLELTYGTGLTQRTLQGKIEITPNVTRTVI